MNNFCSTQLLSEDPLLSFSLPKLFFPINNINIDGGGGNDFYVIFL